MVSVHQNTLSNRLIRLYDAKYDCTGFTNSTGWSQRTARDMIRNKELLKRGLVYSDPDTDDYKTVSSISHRLKEHIKADSICDISGKWLEIYRLFFGCSAAFLCGEIDGFTAEETDIQANTGLDAKAIRTLMNYRISGLIENDNTIGAVLSFLLRPDHCKRNSGGLLHLIAAYLTGDFSVSGMDESINPADYIHTDGRNGSGFEIPTSEIVRAALPNMIQERLHEYRAEIKAKK